MKNKFLFGAIVTTACVLIPCVGVTSISDSLTHFQASGQDTVGEYSLTFDENTRLNKSATSNKSPKIATVLTQQRGNAKIFQYRGLSSIDKKFQKIAPAGFIENLDAFDGITDITFNISGKLSLSYGWIIDENGDKVFSQEALEIVNNGALHFNKKPSFLKISNATNADIEITSIKVNYSCKRTLCPFEEMLDLNYFKNVISNNDATKVTSSILYEVTDLGVALNYDSTFVIDSKDPNVSKFDVRYEKLNPFEADTIKSTVSNTYYTDKYGTYELVDGHLKQVSSTDSSVKIKPINFDNNYIGNYSINRDTCVLSLYVVKGSEKAYLNTDKEISNLTSEISLDKTHKLAKIVNTYDSIYMVNDIKYVASVVSTTQFSYAVESVTIPTK